MKPTDALKEFVTQSRMAELCGVPESNVSRWFAAERIPIKHQATLVIASEGRLRMNKSDMLVAKAMSELWTRAVELST